MPRALGAQVSSHSSITRSFTSVAHLTSARHAAFVVLAERALHLALSTGLLWPKQPTTHTFVTACLLVYTLRPSPAATEELGTYQNAMLNQRARLLDAAPRLPGGADAKVAGGLQVGWALSDTAMAGHNGADRPFRTDHELELHFGLVPTQLDGDLDALRAAAGRVELDGLYDPLEDAKALSDVTTRGTLWCLLSLIEVRRRGRRRFVTLADVASTLGFASTALAALSSAWGILTARVNCFGPAHLAAWNSATGGIGRRLLGTELFAHDVLTAVARGDVRGGDGECPWTGVGEALGPVASLARTMRWRAAKALKTLLSGAQGPVLVPDSLGRPSWLGSYFGSLPPGTGVVELAHAAARAGALGGELEEVGMSIGDLGVMLDGLRQTVVLGGPSGEQAGALEKGIRELETEVSLKMTAG